MPREDLLALSLDDLIALSNRGTVKRAQKEIARGQPTFSIDESDQGGLTVTWSDDVSLSIPPAGTVHDAVCSRGDLALNRMLIRSILAYQAHHTPSVKTNSTDSTSHSSELPTSESWDPGQFDDQQLTHAWGASVLEEADRQLRKAGRVLELTRGPKPLAVFIDHPVQVRFLVPGDPRYVSVQGADEDPAWQAVVAVWAFRELSGDQDAGQVALHVQPPRFAEDLLESLRQMVDDVLAVGWSHLPTSWLATLERLHAECTRQRLLWPADVLNQLSNLFQYYQQHDARFDPLELLHLLGELLIRVQALRHPGSHYPASLIAGTLGQPSTSTLSGRWVGLGGMVQRSGPSCRLLSFLHQPKTGQTVALIKDVDDASEHPTFSSMAKRVVIKGVSIRAAAKQTWMIDRAEQTLRGQLLLKPRGASAQPQALDWSSLSPPTWADSFAQLKARQASRPPRSLAPRFWAENVQVIELKNITQVRFDQADQAVRARLTDTHGFQAELFHPYTSHGQAGAEALLRLLYSMAQRVRFVSAQVSTHAGNLRCQPLGLVVEGESRTLFQPWFDDTLATEIPMEPNPNDDFQQRTPTKDSCPLDNVFLNLQNSLADRILTGPASLALSAWQGRVLSAQLRQVELSVLAQEMEAYLTADQSLGLQRLADLVLTTQLASDLLAQVESHPGQVVASPG